DPRGRHKLRIAAKKLRYATGFFESLFPGRKERKRLRSFERELKAMQDCLGALNDITVHQRLASEFVRRGTRRRERVVAIGLVPGREQGRIDPLRKAAVKAADKFAQARPFWT